MKAFYNVIKIIIDEIIALVALIILAIPFLVVAIIIKCTSKGPVFFKQKRVGKNNKLFYIHKFRTMRIDAPHDTATHLLENPDQYITKIGKFLRKTSMDELPQIIDVLFGKMNFIGMRPALWNQFDLIEARNKKNLYKAPVGISGWAQTHGRDTISIEDKVELDAYYYEHYGLWIDIKCFFLTILKVFKHDDVVEGGTGELEKEEAEKHIAEQEVAATANDVKIDDSNVEEVSIDEVTK